MEDSQIIELYWQREEGAIAATDQKYGSFCHSIAMNLLNIREDAEECVSDTWHQAWLRMPPERPECLKAWLGKIVRNISINLWHKKHAQKRFHGMEEMLDELEDCIPSPRNIEREMEAEEIGKVISAWLKTLPQKDRVMFVRRYWHGVPLNDLAGEYGISSGNLAQKMYRLRLSLRSALEKEDIYL